MPVDDVSTARITWGVAAVGPTSGIHQAGRILCLDLGADVGGGLHRPLTPSLVERDPADDRGDIAELTDDSARLGPEVCLLTRGQAAAALRRHRGDVLPDHETKLVRPVV